jgi:hypothetical protein
MTRFTSICTCNKNGQVHLWLWQQLNKGVKGVRFIFSAFGNESDPFFWTSTTTANSAAARKLPNVRPT